MEWDVPLVVLIFQAQNMEPPVSTEIFTVGLWTYPSTEPLRSSLGPVAAFGGKPGDPTDINPGKERWKTLKSSEMHCFLHIWGMAIMKV